MEHNKQKISTITISKKLFYGCGVLSVVIFLVVSVFLVSIQQELKFQGVLLQVSQYPNRSSFDEVLGKPVYELNSLENLEFMKKMGPIQDELYLSGKTMCLYGYSGIPMRFIIVYYNSSNQAKEFVTWNTP